ncbi:MAG: hypothetical protein WBN28_15135 [Lutimonas sp.]
MSYLMEFTVRSDERRVNAGGPIVHTTEITDVSWGSLLLLNTNA